MAETVESEVVTFEDSQGNEISNDPRWLAKQTLTEAGEDVDALKARIAELEAAQRLAEPPRDFTEPEPTLEDEEGAADEPDEYDSMSGAELKALAAEREVDIKGLTKVGQVRDALRAADEG